MEQEDKRSIDRRTLYEEVWAEPVSIVARRYGLSDVGLAKVCRAMAIPLPSRGYWTKVRAGKVMKKAALPAIHTSEQPIKQLKRLSAEQMQQRAEAREARKNIRKEVEDTTIPGKSASPHPLIAATSQKLGKKEGWPKDTNLHHAPGDVLDIAATPTSLDRALHIAATLLAAFEKHGFGVHVDPKRAATILKQADTGVELSFSLSEQLKRTEHQITAVEELARKRYFERSRKGLGADYPSIPRHDYQATGILTIEIGRYPSQTWKDTPKKTLEVRLGEIVADTLVLAQERHAQQIEEARRAEERRRAIERYDYLVQTREAELRKFQNLETQAADWERAERLRRFADALEQAKSSNGLLTEAVQQWLGWARAKADWLDPLVDVSDIVLSAPEPKKPGYW